MSLPDVLASTTPSGVLPLACARATCCVVISTPSARRPPPPTISMALRECCRAVALWPRSWWR